MKFELLYHAAMPDWVKVRGLDVRPVPECEGGGYKVPAEQGALIAAAPQLAEALREIANVGGNLPDDTLTTRAGANDAVARGLMVVGARSIARAALKAAGIE